MNCLSASGPLGAFVIALLFFSIPRNFPHHNQPRSNANAEKKSYVLAWRQFDAVGTLFLLAASVLLVTAVLQAGDGKVTWSSPTTIVFLVLSGLSWMAFAMWERYITISATSAAQPIFPWRFVLNRPWFAMLL